MKMVSTNFGRVRGGRQALAAWVALHFLPSVAAAATPNLAEVTGYWVGTGKAQLLETWTGTQLERFKKTTRHEKDPVTGKVLKWEGVLLSTLVDAMIGKLAMDVKAQVDLVVLLGENGNRATIPRAFISRYPLLLAKQWDSPGSSDSRGPLYSIVPWTSMPKVLNEDLPVANYFVSRINRIELTSYEEMYKPYFLKRRTDPSAMRGEKLYVQNCVPCHEDPQARDLPVHVFKLDSQKLTGLSQKGHPVQTVALKSRDWLSIGRYVDAFKSENPGTQKSGAGSAMGAKAWANIQTALKKAAQPHSL